MKLAEAAGDPAALRRVVQAEKERQVRMVEIRKVIDAEMERTRVREREREE